MLVSFIQNIPGEKKQHNIQVQDMFYKRKQRAFKVKKDLIAWTTTKKTHLQ
jgi:hypothetical protein